MDLEIQQEIFLTGPPEQVWDFLLNQDGLKRWFEAKIFIVDYIEGGELKFSIIRDGRPYRIMGETGLFHLNKQLIFTWIEQDQFGRSWFTPTNVSFELLPAEGGTQFKLTHNGFKYLPVESREEIYQGYEIYWASVALPRLKTLVESS